MSSHGGLRPGAGRPAGSKGIGPSVQEVRQAVREVCEKKNYKPLEDLIDIVQKERLTLDQKITIHKELLQYVAPKLKAVDIQANVQGDIKVNIVQFSQPKTLDTTVSELPRPVLTAQPIQTISTPPANPLTEMVKEAIKEAVDDEKDDDE